MTHTFVLFTGYNCNFNCSYCFQRNSRKLSVLEDIDVIDKKLLIAATKIVKLFNKNNFIAKSFNNSVQIIGGEPTLFNIEKVIGVLSLSKNITNIRLFSNMSADTSKYKKIIDICNNNNVKLELSCSFHPEKTSLDEFTKKIKQIYIEHKNIKIIPKLVVTNNYNIEFLNNFLNNFKDLNIKASILPEYSPCKESNMVCDFECGLTDKLFNFTLSNILNKCNNDEYIKEIILSSRDKKNRYLKKPILVVPSIYMDYNGKLFYPCNGNKEIKEEELSEDKLKIWCNDKNCMLYNECRKIGE